MSSLLTAIDIFGVSYTLKTNGKDKYRTKLGGCFTIACFVAMAFFSVVFGMDFYTKTNPEVSRNDFEHDKPQFMPLKSYDYMVRIGALNNFNSLTYPYRPYGLYEHGMKKADGSIETICSTPAVISPCTATDAIKNPSLKDFTLSDWYCIDVAKITTICKNKMKVEFYEPIIGGFIGEESYAYIYIAVTNTVYDQDFKVVEQISNEEIKKIPSFLIDIAYPKAYYDSNKSKDALTTKMAVDRFRLQPDSLRFEYRFMKQVKLLDDIGWLLENNQITHSVVLDSIQQMNFNNDLTKEGFKAFFGAVFLLNRNQLEHKRRFMKFQDVLAQVSAFVKGIMQILLFFAVSYASYYMMREMMTGYFGLQLSEVKLAKPNISFDANNVEKIDTIVNTSTLNMKKQTASRQLGYLMFVFSCWFRQNTKTKNQIEFYRIAKDHIDRRLDVMSLLKLLEKFDRLVEKMLSQEDQLDLQRSHSINKL